MKTSFREGRLAGKIGGRIDERFSFDITCPYKRHGDLLSLLKLSGACGNRFTHAEVTEKVTDKEAMQPQMMEIIMKLVLLFAAVTTIAFSQSPSDLDIQAAIERGKTTPGKKLWDEIKKKQQVRMNRAGFGDPIEKKVLLLSDRDRIALEATEAKRQLREITIDDIKKNLPLGVMEVLLEANCYNNMYAGSLSKWGPGGGVHVVLRVGQKVIQPLEKKAGASDSVSVLPQEHSVVSRQGDVVTYTPLYRSAVYERASERAWFTFPALSADVISFTVVAISGQGKQKEKEVENPVK